METMRIQARLAFLSDWLGEAGSLIMQARGAARETWTGEDDALPAKYHAARKR